MIEQLKESWRQFKYSKPGYRFQERYHRRSKNSTLARVLTLVVGVVMVLAGLASMPFPIPADGFLVPLGMMVIASEIKPVARFLDWAESRLREAAGRTLSFWSRASNRMRSLVVAAAVVATIAVLGYGAHSLLSGG